MNNNAYLIPDGDPKNKRSLLEAVLEAQTTMKGLSSINEQNSDYYYHRPTVDEYTQDSNYSFDVEPKRKYSDLTNAVTKWLNEINKMGVSNKQWEVQKQTFEEQSLEAIKEYKRLNSMKKQQLEYIASLDANKDPELIQQASINLKKIEDRIRELDLYFQTERNSDVVLDLMYDRSRLTGDDRLKMAADNIKNSAESWMKETVFNPERLGEDYLWTAKSMTFGAWPIAESIIKGDISPLVDFIADPKPLNHAIDYLAKGHSTVISGAKNLINYLGSNDDLVKDNLKGSSYESNLLALKLYRGNRYSKDTDSAVYDPSYVSLDIKDKDIENAANKIAEKKKELTTELELKMEEARLGKINVGIGDFEIPTGLTYDTEVDEQWEREDQEFTGSLFDVITKPDHALASTASTVSFLRYQLPMMTAEGVTQYLFKKYGSKIILGALPQGRAKAALDWLSGIITAGAFVGEIATAEKSREYETAVEALDAYQERVVNDASHNGADLFKVSQAISNELNGQFGESLSDMPFDEKLKLGIVMGVKTGDPVWDNQLISARKGLMKLINENNTLAIADYIESIPYMPISGSVVSNILKRQVFNNNLVKKRILAGKSVDVSKITGDAADRLWKSNKVQEEISKSLLSPGGLIQTQIDRVAKKVMNKDLRNGLFTHDVLSYLATRIPLNAASSLKEGIEEGLQQLLQSRYSRGEYDQYDKPYSMLDFDAAIADLHLASDAIADYVGLNYGDLDNGDRNLRKAMNIGAISSFIVSQGRHMMTNIPGFHGATPNMTDLVQNMRASNTIAELMANDYQRAQDYLHADLFLKAVERGKNAGLLKDKLLFLIDQQYKVGESAVTQSMVDADKTLIESVYSMYHNKDIRSLAKKHGISPSDEKFRFLMLDGATRITDVIKTAELATQQNKDLLSEYDETSRLLHILLESFDSEQGQELAKNNPTLKLLYDNFQQLYEQATKDREDAIHVNKLEIERDVKKSLASVKEPKKESKKGKNLKEVREENLAAIANKLDSAKEDLYDRYNISEQKRKELDAISKDEDFVAAFVKEALSQTQKDIVRQRIIEAQNVAEQKLKRYEGENDDHFEKRKELARKEAIFNDVTLRGRVRELVRKEGEFPTEAQMRKEVNRRMRALANDELEGTSIDDLIDTHIESTLFAPIQKERFFDNQLFLYYKYKSSSALQKAIDLSKKLNELLKFVRKMSGLDIDTRNLGGIIDTLEQFQKDDQDYQKKFYKSDEENPFKNGKYKWDVENEDDTYEKTAMSMLINRAMQKHQNTIAKAYVYGKVTPKAIQEAVYGLNYDGETEFGELLKIQKDTEKIKAAIGDVEGREGEYAEAELKFRNANEDAAWKLIETRMKESAKRSRIARREFIEDLLDDAGVDMTNKEVDEIENAMDEASGETPEQQEELEPSYTKAQKQIIEEQTGRDFKKEEKQRKKLLELIKNKKENPSSLDEESDEEPKDDSTEAVNDEDVENTEETEEPEEDPEDFGPDSLVDPLENVSTEDESGDEFIDAVATNEEEKLNDLTIALDNLDADVEQFYVERESDEIAANELKDEKIEETLDSVSGWVTIKDFKNLFIDDNGNLCYLYPDGNSVILPEDQAKYIFKQFYLMGVAEIAGLSLNGIPMGEDATDEEYRDNVTEEYIGNLLANTAFYTNDPKEAENSLADPGTKDTFNGVKLPKEIGTAKQLSENLVKPGWLATTKKYYIVTKSNSIRKLDVPDSWRNAMVVALVILDKDKCYLTFLRDLAKGENKKGEHIDNQLYWYNWMLTKNADTEKIEKILGKPLPVDKTKRANAIAKFIKEQTKEKTRLLFERHTDRDTRGNEKDAEIFEKWYKGEITDNDAGLAITREAIVKDSKNLVLRSFSLDKNPKRQLQDVESISNQLNKLAALRNDIINAYLGIDEKQKELVEVPTIAKTTIEPNEVRQSNGKIDNMRSKHSPEFRKLDDRDDIDKLTEDITSGRLLFGYGLGIRSKDKYKITGLLDKDSGFEFHGKGLSGKIYIFKKGLTGNGKLVPIMLSERKFDEQTVVNKNEEKTREYVIKQTLLYKDGTLRNNSAADSNGNVPLPSIAEVLFYMITHKFDFGTTDYAKQSSIVEFFIHHGKDTILSQQPDYSRANSRFLNILASKLINYDFVGKDLVLLIALYNPDLNGYVLTSFKDSDLFDESTPEKSKISENNRQLCIEAIAKQMHWNTDKDHIKENINVGGSATEVSQFIRHMMKIAEQNGDIKTLDQLNGDIDAYLKQSFDVMGCPDMRFVIKDFYKKNEKASITDDPIVARSVNTLAWMINNEVLVTDVSKQIFKDPYVFTFGVKGTAERKLGPVQTPSATPPNTTAGGGELVNKIAVSKKDKEHIVLKSDSEDKKKTILDILNKRTPGIQDSILIESPYSSDSDSYSLNSKNIDQKISEIVEKYEQEHGIKFDSGTSLNPLNLQYLDDGDRAVIFRVIYKDGKHTYNLQLFDTNQYLSETNTYITGVYSLKKNAPKRHGRLDTVKARKWLAQKLGIANYNIYVQRAAFLGAENETAYGFTQLATDEITNNLIARFGLSYAEGSKGVHYHEAWHYVNLLLHTPEQRQAVWNAFVLAHGDKYKGKSNKEIEEAMANDFMLWIENSSGEGRFGIISRVYQSVVDFIDLVRRNNRNDYKKIYKAIKDGGYKSSEMDSKSVQQFLKNYLGIVYQVEHDVHQIPKEIIEKMDSVNKYQDIYAGMDSILYSTILISDIKDVRSAKAFISKNGKINDILKDGGIIDNMIQNIQRDSDFDSLSEFELTSIEILRAIKENPDILKRRLVSHFEKLGFKASFKEEQDNATEKEDAPDNTWDKLELTISKKMEATAQVKLFLSTIPDCVSHINNDGTIKYRPKYDRFGQIKIWDFDKAWNVLADGLCEVRSYGALDSQSEYGGFAKTSFRGTVKRLAKTHPLFFALDVKLDKLEKRSKIDLNYANIKSQLFGVFNSNKNHIYTIDVLNPYSAETIDLDSEEIIVPQQFTTAFADIDNIWGFSDDGIYNPAFTLPRTWSQTLASLDIRARDNSGNLVVSKQFSDKVNKMFDNLRSSIVEVKKTLKLNGSELEINEENNNILSQFLYNKRDGIVGKLVNLYNVLGIPVDSSVLYTFISTLLNTNDADFEKNPQFVFNGISTILTTNGSGSLSDIVTTISSSVGKQEFKAVSGDRIKQKAIDELYTGYHLKTHIAKLALAYSSIYPSLRELSSKSANGDTQYPINLNNYISDVTLKANQNSKEFIKEKKKVPYNRHSIFLQAVDNVNDKIEESRLRLNTFVGMKKVGTAKGSDYLEIIPAEDYLCKLFMTENDNLPFPTMAGKKTYYSLSVGTASKTVKLKIGDKHGFKLVHDTIIVNVDDFDTWNIVESMYRKIDPYDEKKHGSEERYKSAIREWRDKLSNEEKLPIQELAEAELRSRYPENFCRFGDTTINIFCGYFLDEINSLIEYYDEANIKALIGSPTKLLNNFHGEIKDGKLQFGGNGGKFRYFYNMDFTKVDQNLGLKFRIPELQSDGSVKMVQIRNLNLKLLALYELQKAIESGTVKDLTKNKTDIVQNIPESFINQLAQKNGDTDGFELIRMYLKELKKQTVVGQDSYTADAQQLINSLLINATKEELYNLSRSDSQIQLCEKKFGQYYPKGIPEQFFAPYMESLRKLGRAGYKAVHPRGSVKYGDKGAVDALFSLIGSFVANTAIAVIETEKIYTGDPAYYKWSTAKKVDDSGKKSDITLTVLLQLSKNGVKANIKVETDILTESFVDKIKRLGGALSPGTELREDFSQAELEQEKQIIIDHLGEDALDSNFLLNSSQYSVLLVKDAECDSLYLNMIKERFEKLAIIDLIRQGDIKVEKPEEVVREIYDDEKAYAKYYKKFKNVKTSENITVADFIDREVTSMSKPYQKINVADAQVFVRPMMYRNLRKRVGEWTNEDEEAFWILETDDSWMTDEQKSKKVHKFQLNALKMSYFGYDVDSITEGINIDKPLYNKMAIFPLFKLHRSTDVGRMLYDRMNKKGDVLDMIAFSSAVKVGGFANAPESIDSKVAKEDPKKALYTLSKKLQSVGDKTINYSTGAVETRSSKDVIPVSVQSLGNLRLLLNTKAHVDQERSMGTQLLKMAFLNILDSETYDGKLGSDIKSDIIQSIKKLTEFGALKIQSTFFEDGEVSPQKVREYLTKIIDRNGLGAIAKEIIDNGNTISSLMSRDVFEQSLIKKINSEVIDINTKGGAAIQQSIFGFVGIEKNKISKYEDGDKYAEYNNGEELKWCNDDGATEVLLSIKFFDFMIPSDIRKQGFVEKRNWLLKNNIIGKNAKPFGVGYRIPTQGMPSMFAMTVADVLPEHTGDLIVVPREFTGQTGSDFDVDKIYITTLSYSKDCKLYTKEDNNEDGWRNELIQQFITLISAKENFGQARGSIDVFTSILKRPGGVLDLVNNTEAKYMHGFKALSPYFQTSRKMEFAVGKSGIAPFALALANLSLTQTTHLSIDFGEDKILYDLKDLDTVYGGDRRLCSGWLCAMINAHVDVEKDPWVFSLNVNQATYSMTEFLIRTGKGEGTFAFLSQPILKEYAQMVNASGNIWGSDLYGDGIEYVNVKSRAENYVKAKYLGRLEKLLTILNTLNPEDPDLKRLNEIWLYFDYKRRQQLARRRKNRLLSEEKAKDQNEPKLNISWKDVISLETNENSLKKLLEGSDKSRAIAYAHQLLAMQAFKNLEGYADALTNLVQNSQIDTKKFGNTITEQMLFVNKFLNFINGANVNWKITTDPQNNNRTDEEKKEYSRECLLRYFKETFLYDKLEKATSLTQDILTGLAISASDLFLKLFIQIMQEEAGLKEFKHVTFDTYFNDSNGFDSKCRKDKAIAISNALQNVLRYRMFQKQASFIFELLEDDQLSEFARLASGQHEMHPSLYMRYLYFGIDAEGNYTKEGSIFLRLSDLVSEMKDFPDKLTDTQDRAFDRLVDTKGNIQNDLLLYLQPMLPTENYPLGRMMLADSQMDVSSDIKSRYITAFYQLLQHSNPEIQKLAEDLIVFAYYSQYDQNVPGSFFDLVPYKYRLIYDKSLTSALLYNEDVQEDQIAELKDIIARNYWYSDDIVPRHAFKDNIDYSNIDLDDPTRKIIEITDEDYFETGMLYYYDAQARSQFPGCVITTKASSAYIKLSKNGQTYLYRNSGKIVRTTGEDKKGSDAYIYIAIPKAGVYTKGIKLFEFYANYEVDSIFEQNKLPDIFAEDVLRKEVTDWVNEKNEIPSKRYVLSIKWGIDQIPETRTRLNVGAYKEVATIKNSSSGTEIEGVAVPRKRNNENVGFVDHVGLSKADVIINIISKEADRETNRKHIKDSNESKTFDVVIGQPINIDKFSDFIKLFKFDDEKQIIIHVTSPISDGEFYNSKSTALSDEYKKQISEDVENMIQQQLQDYKKELDEDEELKDLERVALYQNKESTLREELNVDKLRRVAVREYMYGWYNDVAKTINSSGININNYTSSINSQGRGEIVSGCVSYNYANDFSNNTGRPKIYIDEAYKTAVTPSKNSYKAAKYNRYNMFIKQLKSIYSLSRDVENREELLETTTEEEREKAFTELPNTEMKKEFEKAKKESETGTAPIVDQSSAEPTSTLVKEVSTKKSGVGGAIALDGFDIC